MGKPAFDIRTSHALKLAQRVTCSGFSLAVLQDQYVPGSSCWKKLERRLASLRRPSQKDPALLGLSAKSFREAWRLEHRLQLRNIDAMASYGKGPSYLRRLARIEKLSPEDLRAGEYIPTFVAALMALEWNRPERKASARAAKRARAIAVLKRIRERWKPNRAGVIDLPALEFDGSMGLSKKLLRDKGDSELMARKRIQMFKQYLDRCTMRISQKMRAQYPDTDAYRTLEYMVKLAFDKEPIPEPLLPRWGLDIASCVLATEALFIADADSPDFADFHRIRADANLGAAQFFMNAGVQNDQLLLERFQKFAREIDPTNTLIEDVWGITALSASSVKFRALIQSLGVDLRWLHDTWTQAHADMPSKGFTRLGRPLKYRPAKPNFDLGPLWKELAEEIEKIGTDAKAYRDRAEFDEFFDSLAKDLETTPEAVRATVDQAMDQLQSYLDVAAEQLQMANRKRTGRPMNGEDWRWLQKLADDKLGLMLKILEDFEAAARKNRPTAKDGPAPEGGLQEPTLSEGHHSVASNDEVIQRPDIDDRKSVS